MFVSRRRKITVCTYSPRKAYVHINGSVLWVLAVRQGSCSGHFVAAGGQLVESLLPAACPTQRLGGSLTPSFKRVILPSQTFQQQAQKSVRIHSCQGAEFKSLFWISEALQPNPELWMVWIMQYPLLLIFQKAKKFEYGLDFRCSSGIVHFVKFR